MWVLLQRVTNVQRDNNTYTFTVEPTGRSFQSIFIRRLNPVVVLRFVTPDGRELERWDESDPPTESTTPTNPAMTCPRVGASSGRMEIVSK